MKTAGEILVIRPDSPVEPIDITVDRARPLEIYHIAADGGRQVRLRISEGGRAKVVFAALGGADSRLDYSVALDGANAELELYGFFAAGAGEHCTVRMEVRHNVPDCRSSESVKGVAAGDGYGVFNGLVYVAPDAQRTEAYQQNRNLLLSPKARIETHPQLEIYADDVRCSHGATVGQSDEEQIYYMRQRGIDYAEARRLQTAGFLRDILSHIDDESLREEFSAAVDNKLETLQ